MKLLLERTQYGIGQGCFHVQRLAMMSGQINSSHWIPNADLGRPFDVVYDCGSAPSQTVGGTKPLDWAIEHYRPSKDGEADSIDVVLLRGSTGVWAARATQGMWSPGWPTCYRRPRCWRTVPRPWPGCTSRLAWAATGCMCTGRCRIRRTFLASWNEQRL